MEVIRFDNEFRLPWALLLSIVVLLSCQSQKPRPIRVAVAANQAYVIDTVVMVFEKKFKTKCDVILGPSARLMTQIDQGAPYDIFLSADKKYPQILNKRGLTTDPPRAYSIGKLALLYRGAAKADLAELSNNTINKIAIPNPDIAPYGQAARKVLMEKEIWQDIKGKVVFGESVSQTNQFYLSRNVDAAITSSSILYAPAHVGKNIGDGQVLQLEAIVTHYGVVVKHGNTHEKAQDFFSFILSPEGQAILKKYGYLSSE